MTVSQVTENFLPNFSTLYDRLESLIAPSGYGAPSGTISKFGDSPIWMRLMFLKSSTD